LQIFAELSIVENFEQLVPIQLLRLVVVVRFRAEDKDLNTNK